MYWHTLRVHLVKVLFTGSMVTLELKPILIQIMQVTKETESIHLGIVLMLEAISSHGEVRSKTWCLDPVQKQSIDLSRRLYMR